MPFGKNDSTLHGDKRNRQTSDGDATIPSLRGRGASTAGIGDKEQWVYLAYNRQRKDTDLVQS